ncbi:MAG: hypothetical protein EAY66_08040 [Sphingobacteriales bacterium]|nr:MAG: hypothetical protein EAY66_08040 [Sphingobacteriales bacterium]
MVLNTFLYYLAIFIDVLLSVSLRYCCGYIQGGWGYCVLSNILFAQRHIIIKIKKKCTKPYQLIVFL